MFVSFKRLKKKSFLKKGANHFSVFVYFVTFQKCLPIHFFGNEIKKFDLFFWNLANQKSSQSGGSRPPHGELSCCCFFEEVLRFSNLFMERVFLYKSRGLHGDALDLLVHNSNPKTKNTRILETVKYLQFLGTDPVIYSIFFHPTSDLSRFEDFTPDPPPLSNKSFFFWR